MPTAACRSPITGLGRPRIALWLPQYVRPLGGEFCTFLQCAAMLAGTTDPPCALVRAAFDCPCLQGLAGILDAGRGPGAGNSGHSVAAMFRVHDRNMNDAQPQGLEPEGHGSLWAAHRSKGRKSHGLRRAAEVPFFCAGC